MRSLHAFIVAGLMAMALVFAPAGAQAQPAAAPAQSSSFDIVRAAVITTGVVVGSVVAVIVTDGLIIPAYAYATGATGVAAEGTMAAAMGGYVTADTVRNVMSLFGAISGGLFADSWYRR